MNSETFGQVQQRLTFTSAEFEGARLSLEQGLADSNIAPFPDGVEQLREYISRTISGMRVVNSAAAAIGHAQSTPQHADWQDNCLATLRDALDDISHVLKSYDLPAIMDSADGSHEAAKRMALLELRLANLRLQAASFVTAGRCLVVMLIDAFVGVRVEP